MSNIRAMFYVDPSTSSTQNIAIQTAMIWYKNHVRLMLRHKIKLINLISILNVFA